MTRSRSDLGGFLYIPEPPVTFLNKEDDVVVTGYEAESVTLTSYVSKESAVVRWLKDWTPAEGERFRTRMEGHKRTFTIDPLKRSDAGEYICDINTDQIHFSLLVKGRNVSLSSFAMLFPWMENNRLGLLFQK